MATQVITRTLCDYCQHDDDVETPESTRLVVVLAGDEFEVDLCSKHRKPFDDLAESLGEVGRKVPRRGRKPKGATDGATSANGATDPNHGGNLCPLCGVVLGNRSSLTAHTRQRHGKSLGELQGQPLAYECAECGKKFTKPQGLGVHKRVHAS